MMGLGLCAAAMLMTSCGEPVGGMGKSPVYLTCEHGGLWAVDIDVYDSSVPGGVADDTTTLNINSKYKNASLTTPYADVILQQYHVTYYRPDGKTDVPAPLFGHMQNTVPGGGSATVEIDIVRRDAKLRSPLKELVLGGGEGDIRMNAIVEFFGEDLMGNNHSTKCILELHAYDF